MDISEQYVRVKDSNSVQVAEKGTMMQDDSLAPVTSQSCFLMRVGQLYFCQEHCSNKTHLTGSD